MRYAVFAILLSVALARASDPQADQRLAADRAEVLAYRYRILARLRPVVPTLALLGLMADGPVLAQQALNWAADDGGRVRRACAA